MSLQLSKKNIYKTNNLNIFSPALLTGRCITLWKMFLTELRLVYSKLPSGWSTLFRHQQRYCWFPQVTLQLFYTPSALTELHSVSSTYPAVGLHSFSTNRVTFGFLKLPCDWSTLLRHELVSLDNVTYHLVATLEVATLLQEKVARLHVESAYQVKTKVL